MSIPTGLPDLKLPVSGVDGWNVLADGEVRSGSGISSHEEVHEPLNPPDAPLSRIEQPCTGEFWLEVGYQKIKFTCNRRLDHTGKHAASYTNPEHDKLVPRKDHNMSAGKQVSLAW